MDATDPIPSVPTLLLRATLFYTPTDPFTDPRALVHWEDGGLLVAGERIAAVGSLDRMWMGGRR